MPLLLPILAMLRLVPHIQKSPKTETVFWPVFLVSRNNFFFFCTEVDTGYQKYGVSLYFWFYVRNEFYRTVRKYALLCVLWENETINQLCAAAQTIPDLFQ